MPDLGWFYLFCVASFFIGLIVGRSFGYRAGYDDGLADAGANIEKYFQKELRDGVK